MSGTPLRQASQGEFHRAELVTAALDWVFDPKAPAIRAIVGAPGAGKSVVGRQILRVAAEGKSIQTVYGNAVRVTVAHLVEIVRKLDAKAAAEALDILLIAPATRSSDVNITIDHTTVGGDMNITLKEKNEEKYGAVESAQIVHAVVEPILNKHKTNVLALLDVEDEDATASTRRFVEDLLGAGTATTPHVRWLVTARPGTLAGMKAPSATYAVADLDDPEPQRRDVDAHLRDVLRRRKFDNTAIARWQEVCAGNFLVAHHLLQDLLEDPDLESGVWIAHPGLGGVYNRFLARLPIGPDGGTAHALEVLTLIAAAGRNRITFDALRRRCASNDDGGIRLAVGRARQFLTVDNQRYATYHQSFSDHLLTPSDDDPTSQSRIRDAHHATVIDDLDPRRFTHLGPIEYGRLPWHISRIIDLTSPDDRFDLDPDPNALLWRMYHERGVANRTMETDDVHAMYNPFHHTMLLFLAPNLEDLDPEPTPESLASRHNIAHWLGRLERQAEAISVLQLVVKLRADKLGPFDPATLNSLENLAYRVGQSGQEDKAVEIFREALVKRNDMNGELNDRATLQTLHDLAYWTARAGDIPEAVSTFREVANRRAEFFGPIDRATLQARHNLAYWMDKLDDPAAKTEAFQILKAVLDDRCQHLPGGRVHPDAMASRALYAFRLGVRASTADELAVAIDELESVLRDREAWLGNEHPGVGKTRKTLAALRRRGNLFDSH